MCPAKASPEEKQSNAMIVTATVPNQVTASGRIPSRSSARTIGLIARVHRARMCSSIRLLHIWWLTIRDGTKQVYPAFGQQPPSVRQELGQSLGTPDDR